MTMRTKIGILIASAAATIYLALFLARSTPMTSHPAATLVRSIQILRIAQSERFQSDLRFAESNAEAAQMVGDQVKFGRIEGAGPVMELNVRAGGVIELLLDDKDRDGRRQRAIFLPMMADPIGSQTVQWQCYSANWENVAQAGFGCAFNKTAWELERQHVARLRAAVAQQEKELERSRAQRESEQARADFDRQRAELARESERAREEEEKQLARIERETERARVEYERRRQ